ncbi:sulfite exporter TauE/SafE family protein [Bacillus kexueae]|uniref:urease accessory protein UreH domain-containing protein n=1 Tax=Aeribacillus kexueae TaxID=2078952 RepID=UPI001FAF7469|nr:sulfite exporter TauE/SafE family protein [Bacillus kexueae]
MYQIFSTISNLLSQPLLNVLHSVESIPLIAAFLLGLVGALAPCQFTGNLGAITFYGHKSLKEKVVWTEVMFFILGKVVVFSAIGFSVWILGQEFRTTLTLVFPWVRKLIGPIMILIGLYLAGYIKMHWTVSLGKVPDKLLKKGRLGAFLMGFSFSLGFCPTMFVLFFASLMPLVLSTKYGAVLPSIFAIGTSVPLIFSLFFIWFFDFESSLLKKGRKLGKRVQKLAGWFIILIGVTDTFTYWA